MGLRSKKTKKNYKFSYLLRYLENIYAAIAFTDLNCHDMAFEILKGSKIQKSTSNSLTHFLEEIGLSGVRYYYVMAYIP